jgi:hypothetical protein
MDGDQHCNSSNENLPFWQIWECSPQNWMFTVGMFCGIFKKKMKNLGDKGCYWRITKKCIIS